MSVGAGVSAAAGAVGRAAEADLRAGDGGYAACYTYSCSKGTFYYKYNSLFVSKYTLYKLKSMEQRLDSVYTLAYSQNFIMSFNTSIIQIT